MNIDASMALAEPLVFTAEGCRLTAWLDTLPDPPVWTIGHGNTWVDGHAVHAGMTCTRLQADAWGAFELRKVAEQVLGKVKVPIDDFQLAALTSLAYNIGIGGFAKSSVLEAVNLGLMQVAADRFLEYDEAGGKKIAGLETRRARERALFLTAMRDPVGDHGTPIAAPAALTADALNEQELDKLQSGKRLTGHQSPSEPDPPPAA